MNKKCDKCEMIQQVKYKRIYAKKGQCIVVNLGNVVAWGSITLDYPTPTKHQLKAREI